MTHRWERTREGLIVVYSHRRRWDTEIILYRGSRVEFDSFTHKYDGCEMHRNIIDGRTYPFAHRTKGKAISAAIQIINLGGRPTDMLTLFQNYSDDNC